MTSNQYMLTSTDTRQSVDKSAKYNYDDAQRSYCGCRPVPLAIIVGAFIIAVGLAIGLAVGLSSRHVDSTNVDITETKSGELSSKVGRYRYAAVAADATICSHIGTDVLARQRGSAVDAAIATLFCMGAANLHSMGIGGGFFGTIFDSKSGKVSVVDAREEAPGGATQNMYDGDSMGSKFGGLSIGVPGEVKGYWEMHMKYGRLPWSQLLQPTIRMCEDGFPMTAAAARAIGVINRYLQEPLRTFLTNPDTGRLIEEGELMKCPKLAQTLRVLAEEGGNSFYNGTLADDVIQDIKDAGGIITKADLASYTAKWKTPVTFSFDDGLSLYSLPPPSSGGVISLILNILEGYRFNNQSLSSDDHSVLTYHRIAEAMKFAYAKRTHLGDSDFVDTSELTANMTSRDFGESLRQLISDQRTHGVKFYGGTFHDEVTTGTAHLSLIDSDGNAVSVTSTINLYFGSGVIGNRTGIIFNDEMDDFSSPEVTNSFGIPPSSANFIAPGKRPLSSMCPVVILDKEGKVKMVTGAAGGSKITTATALVILRSLRLGQDLKTSTDAPRFHHQLLPNELQVETGRLSENIREGLRQKGHKISDSNPRGSVVQTILVKDGEIMGISDERKSADADGY